MGTKNEWTEFDETFIKNNYDKLSNREIADILQKPYQAVNSKVGYYKKYKVKGLVCPTGEKHKEERLKREEKLRQELVEESKELSQKVELKITHKKHSKPKKRIPNTWTDDEIDYLKNNYKIKTRRQISIELNKTENNVRSKLIELNLKKINKNGPSYKWTEQEDQIIKNIAHCQYINKEDRFKLLCSLLERKEGAIYRRIGELKLRKYFGNMGKRY